MAYDLRGYVTARDEDGLWYVQSATYARGKCVGVIFCAREDDALIVDSDDAIRILAYMDTVARPLYQLYYRAWLNETA